MRAGKRRLDIDKPTLVSGGKRQTLAVKNGARYTSLELRVYDEAGNASFAALVR